MVVTRSQFEKNNPLDSETISDSESNQSVPEVLSRAHMFEFNNGEILDRNRGSDNDRMERRFSDMNRQIGNLTKLTLSYRLPKSYPHAVRYATQ